MIEQNKKAIIAALIVMLVPVLFGLIMWDKMPEMLPTHWNALGEIDDYSSRAFTVFGLNGILLATFVFCVLITAADPKRKNISPKMFKLVIWIMPPISLFANALTYSAALGYEPDVTTWSKVLIAIVMILLGNFTPKMRQNYSIGIKLPWTLASEDNWNRTHRFTGKLMIILGILLLIDAFAGILSFGWYIGIIIVATLVPFLYSYIYYIKHDKN